MSHVRRVTRMNESCRPIFLYVNDNVRRTLCLVCTYMRAYIHVYMYTYMHIYMYTCIYTCIYIYSLKAEGVDARGLHKCILDAVNKETLHTTHGHVTYIHVCVYVHKCIYIYSLTVEGCGSIYI